MVSPFMPATAREIARQLGISDEIDSLKWSDATRELPLTPGTKTQGPDPIFPRLGDKKKEVTAKVSEEVQEAAKPEPGEDRISYDYFSKLKIRIAEVKAARESRERTNS